MLGRCGRDGTGGDRTSVNGYIEGTAVAEDDAKGTRIGGFEILERVGKGGMGTVFKARQVSMDRIVALKVLPPKRAKDDAYVQRFIREARSAARLTHNNIVQAIEVGRDGPYHFFAMEFVDGPTIRDLIEQEGRLDERRALDIVKPVAHALERAHREGIVHRDIKPDNIMIGSDGVVKLADLGLARSSEKPSTLTIEGEALGTPYYMSPEQVRGEVELDTRADIYALGATLFHMVTGQAPFQGPNAGAIMAKHITEPVPSARATCPVVSPACSQLIEYMLAKDRDDRPSTPTDLLVAIDDALAGRVHLRSKRRRRGPKRDATGHSSAEGAGGASLPRVRRRSRAARWVFASIAVLILAIVLVWLVRPGGQAPVTQPRASTDATVVAERQRAEAAARKQREDAARQAWEQLARYARATLDENRAKRLLTLADDFDARHGKTELYGTVRHELAQLRTRARTAAQPKLTRPSQPPIPDSLVYTKWPFDEAEAKRRQNETAKALGVPVERDIDIGNGVKMTMVLIPAGEFLMGSAPTTSPQQLEKIFGKDQWADYSREFPQHHVKISKPFWLGKTEVTQAQWEAVMGENPSKFKGKPQNPVEQVSRHDCQGFLQKLSAKSGKAFRLPTEAEWEYACRAGTVSEFYFGDSQSALAQHAWFSGNSGRTTHPVGQTKPNAWGLHDMGGNLWEWCEDWYGPYKWAGDVDPRGPADGRNRVLRGGSWRDSPRYCRSAYRRCLDPSSRYHYHGLGFRVRVVPGPRPRAEAPAPKLPGRPQDWVSLFDGRTLKGWKVADEGEFAKHGSVEVEGGRIVLGAGNSVTGIATTREVPTDGYEISLEAMRVAGDEDFGSVVFPVGVSRCSLVVGGAGGRFVGLMSVDGRFARENPTARWMNFDLGRWYRVRLRVTQPRIEAWIDDEKMIDFPTAGRRLTTWSALSELTPFGLYTVRTTSALRNIRLRRLRPAELPPEPAGAWTSLFDGKTLDGWRVAVEGDFAKDGGVEVAEGKIVFASGGPRTGIASTRSVPAVDYEVTFEAMRAKGNDRFAALVFPVGDRHTLWAIGRSGASCGFDQVDAKTDTDPANPTRRQLPFENGRWYRFRLRVERERVQAWIDDTQVVDLPRRGHWFWLWDGFAPLKPLGFLSWGDTEARLRSIRLRRLGPQEREGVEEERGRPEVPKQR